MSRRKNAVRSHLSKKAASKGQPTSDSHHISTSKSHSKQQPLKNPSRYVKETAEDYEDEVDAFHNSRNMVMLNGTGMDDEGSGSDFVDTVMDLPTSDDDNGNDNYEDYSDDDDDEEKGEETWGRAKKNYYQADLDAKEEEAAEAAKLHRKKLAALSDADFDLPSKVSSSSLPAQNGQPVYFSSEDENEDEQPADLNDNDNVINVDELRQELQTKTAFLKEHLTPLLHKPHPVDLDKSVFSFLRLKHKLTQAYCTTAAFFIAAKTDVKRSKDAGLLRETVAKLIEYRLLLERIRPMEIKLQPQVDRLLQAVHVEEQQAAAVQAGALELVDDDSEEEALLAKPRPQTMRRIVKDTKSDDSGEDDDLYRAPKTMPMPYPESGKHATEKQSTKPRSRLLVEPSDDDDATPERFDASSSDTDADDAIRTRDEKRLRDLKARRAYEEDNMMRFLETKADRRLAEKLAKPRDELASIDKLLEKSGKRKYTDNDSDSDDMISSKRKSKKHIDQDDESSAMSEIEDDMPAPRKPKKTPKGTTTYRPIVDQAAGRDRPINYAISKNKGLTPHRPSEYRNPRVKNRMRFERATKKLGSFRRVAGEQGKKYAGETSGIRTNISRSVRY